MSEMRTSLFIDIDGVLAPTGSPERPSEASWYALPPGDTWVYDATIRRLAALAGDGLADFAWLTTWNSDALDLALAVGLPRWPVRDRSEAPSTEAYPFADWWKERVVRDALAAGERVVWIDDQIDWRTEADLLERRFGDRLLLVQPDEHEGLTPAQVDAVEFWLRAENA